MNTLTLYRSETFLEFDEIKNHPLSESIWATALPIPLAPPLMNADFPDSDMFDYERG